MSPTRCNREEPAGGKSLAATAFQRTAVALAVLVPCGCATFDPKPIAPALTAAAFDARRLDTPELRRFIETQLGRELPAWPPNEHNPWTTELFTLTAYFYHPALDHARSRIATAQAAEITAGARPNPTASLSPTFNFDAAGALSPWKPVVDFDLPIETAGKRALRLARARQLTEAARHEFLAAAWGVRAGVRAAMADLRFARSLHAYASFRADLLKEQADLAALWLEAGESSQSDLTLARLAQEKSRLELDLALERRVAARATLAAAIGVPLRSITEIPVLMTSHSPQLSDTALAALRERALQGRADLRAALAAYEASQIALQLEIAKQHPDVHLGTGYEWDEGQSKWKLFSIGIEIPAFNRNAGPIAEARARRDEAAAKVDLVQSRAAAEIDAAVAFFNSARARTFTEKAMFDAVKSNEAAARVLVQSGEGTRLDLLRARLEWLDAQRIHAEVGRRLWQAENALSEALQQPLDHRPGLSAAPPSESLAAPAPKNPRP